MELCVWIWFFKKVFCFCYLCYYILIDVVIHLKGLFSDISLLQACFGWFGLVYHSLDIALICYSLAVNSKNKFYHLKL